MRRAAKRDDNEPEIVEVLTAMGCTVSRLDGPHPDLLIGEPRYGRNILMEVKDGRKPPADRPLTSSQKKYHEWYKGRIHVVLDAQSAIDVLKHYWKIDERK